MGGVLLEIVDLTAGYGPTRVIEHVSFSVPAGGKLAVLGRNGVGKTTLLATIMGLTRQQSGKILLRGADISHLNTSSRARLGIGYVPQMRDIFASLTVEENLFVGLKGRPRDAIEEAYRLFPRLKERRLSGASNLSGGEQQMLSTARSILGNPDVLLMDEPLEGLAPIICDELMAALELLAKEKAMTIVVIEQQIERMLDFTDEVLILERGQVVWHDTSDSLRQQGDVVEAYLGVRKLGEEEPAATAGS